MAYFLYRISLFAVLLLLTSAGQVNNRYYPRYHLAPPYGWMNDPNGFSIFQGEYHLFYQFNPNSSLEPGIAHWGHAISPDLLQWKHLPITLYPDKSYDDVGVFSGSALIEDDVMYLYYSGNIKNPGPFQEHSQSQCLAISKDGVTATKIDKNPLIQGNNIEPNVRDPKVWKHGNKYYMVLGNSFQNNTRGRILLYSSDDKLSWKQASVLHQSDGTDGLGFMWECPDLFELNGKFVLLFSPQGIAPQGDKYHNLFQCGYFVGNFDYSTNIFTPITEFQELDHGHDFYATQSIIDKLGQRVVIAWFDMWEPIYPEREDGFTGCMTIPRTLSLTKDNRLLQKPAKAFSGTRFWRYIGAALQRKGATLADKAGEIRIIAGNSDLEVLIESQNAKVSLTYSYLSGTVTLDRGGTDGVRRTNWRPRGILRWTIFVDASTVELFCGDGEVTFSSRFFPDGPVTVRLGEQSSAYALDVRDLPRSVPMPGDNSHTYNTYTKKYVS